MRLFTILCAVLWSSTPAQSQTTSSLDVPLEIAGWEAVGRLDIAGGFCTGTLIERDVVLTAAHCVFDRDSGRNIPPSQIVFRAGYNNGSAVASRRVETVHVDPMYKPAPGNDASAETIPYDVALLKLETEVLSSTGSPFRIHTRANSGDSVVFVSYGHDRAEALQLESGCALKHRYSGDILGFDCDATFGSSGAPVFIREDGVYRILSVISAGPASGAGEVYGMVLPARVAPLMSALRARQGGTPAAEGARRITVGGGARTSGGARFIRPGS